MLFSPVEIQETVNMFMRQKLDIRCITMGISLWIVQIQTQNAPATKSMTKS